MLIAPEPILDACEALGRRLALAAEGGERVLIATGHPGGLDLLYRELERLLLAHGGRVIKPADGASWRDPRLRSRLVDRLPLGRGHADRRPRAAPHALAGRHAAGCWRRNARTWSWPTTGSPGAAIEAGVETVSVADVNDPALLVAKAQGRTDVVVVMDDHVAADAYWPCFQAAASAFPQVTA